MHILCLGLNHVSAPVRLRECVALNEEGVRVAFTQVNRAAIAEMVILSTCNRVEMYAVSETLSFDALESLLSGSCSVSVPELRSHSYRKQDLAAVEQLFRVAAGLDSLVIGEPQILGQVTRALELARAQDAAGPILTRLFQAAIHAGKRARSETAISRNPASVSSLAASAAEKAIGHIRSASVAVIGAGETAELMVEALRKRGVERIKLINRTLARARDLAGRWNAEAVTFESLQDAIGESDILISSTSAPHWIVTREMVEAAMQMRAHRPLVLIDLAVPRDIDPNAAEVPGIKLFDIDNLNLQLEGSLASRLKEAPHVQRILDEEAVAFGQFLNALTVLPVIADMHEQAEAIRAAELEKTLRRMPDLTDTERDRIHALTQALVKKILDQPTRHLRNGSASPDAHEYTAMVRTLFGLKPKTGMNNISSPASAAD